MGTRADDKKHNFKEAQNDDDGEEGKGGKEYEGNVKNSRSEWSFVGHRTISMFHPTLEPPLQKVSIELNDQIR